MNHYLILMRPKQWIKNLAVLVGPAFALTFDAMAMMRTGVVFAAFCLVSSASYAVNDVLDREADARHPIKKHRPLASGAISPLGALVWAIALLAAGVVLCARLLPSTCVIIILGYFVMILAYSLALKRRMILDVILIAVGFVLRATAGADAVGAFVSPWLIVCTFTLCMFMGFGKRRCEIAQFDSLEEAGRHRNTLLRYTPELLNNLISVSAGITIVTFLLYTMDKDTPSTFPKEHLMFTLPLVVYGVFRYSMLVQSGKMHGPMDIVLRDRPFQGTVVVWALMAAAIMFEDKWAEIEIVRGIIGEGVQP
ncbi:MAG: decaprenyl-phosphate phosphoribosyltransferase [Phycisphaerae bacterium]